MRNHTLVRPANEKDWSRFAQWQIANHGRNGFDPAVVSYPSTFTLCAYNQQGPLAYLPVQQAFFLESLAPRPGADEREIAVALRELVHALITQAHIKGVGEIYFLESDGATAQFAARQMFEKVPYSLYRVKLASLESVQNLETT